MRILSFDPGVRVIGYVCLDVTENNEKKLNIEIIASSLQEDTCILPAEANCNHYSYQHICALVNDYLHSKHDFWVALEPTYIVVEDQGASIGAMMSSIGTTIWDYFYNMCVHRRQLTSCKNVYMQPAYLKLSDVKDLVPSSWFEFFLKPETIIRAQQNKKSIQHKLSPEQFFKIIPKKKKVKKTRGQKKRQNYLSNKNAGEKLPACIMWAFYPTPLDSIPGSKTIKDIRNHRERVQFEKRNLKWNIVDTNNLLRPIVTGAWANVGGKNRPKGYARVHDVGDAFLHAIAFMRVSLKIISPLVETKKKNARNKKASAQKIETHILNMT